MKPWVRFRFSDCFSLFSKSHYFSFNWGFDVVGRTCLNHFPSLEYHWGVPHPPNFVSVRKQTNRIQADSDPVLKYGKWQLLGRKNNFPSMLLSSWLEHPLHNKSSTREKQKFIPYIYLLYTWEITGKIECQNQHIKYFLQLKTKERYWEWGGQLWEVTGRNSKKGYEGNGS